MKAIRMHEYGGPEVLKFEEAPKPQIKSDEILIKVHASSVNPVDWKIREGRRKDKFPSDLPLTPGWDVSGVVEEIGSGIKDFKPGDEVYGRPDPTKNGAYAEYIAVKGNQVCIKPKSITHDEAAAVPLACLTAWQGLFDFGLLKLGQKVLIHAASGGVGSFAVQLAKWKGAYVIGTSSKNNIDFVKQLGADEVIDYKQDRFEKILRDIDLVFDTIGGETQKKSIQVVRSGGILITTLEPVSQKEAFEKNIHLQGFIVQSYPHQLKLIARLIDEGVLKIFISKIFPLEEAAEAQRLSELGHTRGKTVLEVMHY
jgi:NADPH:quinone reductase-like Zn-dependent oxidoreductase